MPTTFFSKLTYKLIKETCEKHKHDSETADQGFGASYLRNLKLGAAKRQILVELVARLDPTQDSTPFGNNDQSSLDNLKKILLEAEADVIKATKNPEFVGASGVYPGQTELMLGGLIDALPHILDRVKGLNLFDRPYDTNSAHLVFYFMIERFYAHMLTAIKFRERLKNRDDKALPNPTPFAYAQKELVREVYDDSKPKIAKLLLNFDLNPLLPITEALLVKTILNDLVKRHTVLASVHGAQNDPMFMLFSEYLNNAEKGISRLASTDNISSDGHIETLSVRSGSISTRMGFDLASDRTTAFARDSAARMQRGGFETASKFGESDISSLSSSPRGEDLERPPLNHQSPVTVLAAKANSMVQELNADDTNNNQATPIQASTVASSGSTTPGNDNLSNSTATSSNPFVAPASETLTATNTPGLSASPAELNSHHAQVEVQNPGNPSVPSLTSDLASAPSTASATLLSSGEPGEEPQKEGDKSSTAAMLEKLSTGGTVATQSTSASASTESASASASASASGRKKKNKKKKGEGSNDDELDLSSAPSSITAASS